MKLPRRKFLRLAASAAALPVLPRVASALDYPTRPVRIILGFGAGAAADITARLVAQSLSERLGQQFVVENRPGAATNIATEFVVRAAPDGYTLLLATAPNAINATLYNNLNFNFIRDIAPVASIDRGPGVMQVSPVFPGKTVPEFIAYAKANPGTINMATSGNGSTPHLYGELFKMLARVDMVPIPYNSTAAGLTDLMGGRVQVMFAPISASIELIRAGKLLALAVTGATRSEVLPEVPTVGEYLPGYEAVGWHGIGAPRNTPVEVVDKLNKVTNAALSDPSMKKRIAGLGYAVFESSPAEFGRFIAEDTERWAKVVKFAGLKPA